MFKVKSKDGSVALTKEQLLQTLLQKVTETRKKDIEILAKTIAEYLEVKGMLKTTNTIQLLTLAFGAGYYYKVFLSKNEVEIDASDSETSDESSSN